MAVTPGSRQIKIYDTTLRDGTQGEGVAFSMEDKVRIAHRLDQLGVHYIEGGWPGSNPKDLRFFKRVQDAVFKSAKISAFGATRRPGVRPQEDGNLQALVEAGPPVVTIFGKAWDFHVTSARMRPSCRSRSPRTDSSERSGNSSIGRARPFLDRRAGRPIS